MAATVACNRGKEEAPAPATEEAVAKADEPAKAEDAKAEEAKAEEAKAEDAKTDEPPKDDVNEEAPADPVAPDSSLASAAASKELLAYVPDSAKLVLVADPKAVGRSSLFASSSSFAGKLKASRVGEVGDAAKACSVGIDTWSSVLIAGDGDSERTLVMGVRATGIGKKETVQCLADRINALGEPGKWVVSEEQGRVTFHVEDREDRGIAAADDVLLMVGKDYLDDVNAILDGKGKSAVDGELGKLVQSVDRSRHVYFVGQMPPGMTDPPFANMQHLSGTLDFSSGLALGVAFTYGDAATAEFNARTFTEVLELTKGQATAFGIPPAVMSSVKIETKGTTVSARASASKTDLEAMATVFQEKL